MASCPEATDPASTYPSVWRGSVRPRTTSGCAFSDENEGKSTRCRSLCEPSRGFYLRGLVYLSAVRSLRPSCQFRQNVRPDYLLCLREKSARWRLVRKQLAGDKRWTDFM